MSETITIKGRFQTLLAPLAQMVSLNPVLLSGESWTEQNSSTGFSTGRRKIGDGVTEFNLLPFEPTIGDHLAALDPHPQYSKPIEPVFAYSPTTGLLLSVTYGDGSTKIFNWTGQQLTSFDYTRNGTTTRYSFVYLDGIVQSISQEVT